MKNQKKKSLKTALLMGVAVVLVAALSVGISLAYLTANSSTKTNTFTASGGITGEVAEPSFDSSDDYTYYPGEEIDKDPLIQNTTADSSIYVGARLDFYISVNGGSYQQVKYDVFSYYATIYYNTSVGFNTTNWTDITSDVTGDTQGSKYFVYNTVLSSKSTTSVSSTYSENGSDCTTPIFTSVVMSTNITLSSSGTASDLATSSDGVASLTYKSLNFQIVVTGYGVKADSTVTSVNAAKTLIIAGLTA